MPRFPSLLGFPMLLLAGSAAAQEPRLEPPPRVGTDTVVTAADSSHAGGPVHRFFFGSGYRDLWVKPIKVPILDLDRFDGGLRATESGGGEQTRSLRLENAAGWEWTFRSVQKDVSSILPEGLRRSFIVGIVNDQVSHAHPGGALIVPPLASAIGVLHAQPQLAIMPDDPQLGEFREEYAGMLGIIEEFMDDLPDGEPGFAGSDDIVNSLDLLEELREDPEVRIDAHSFLKARLLDFLINDWDRHKDQWRWARLERDGREWWVPIPRDRDNALFHFDGFLPGLARFAAPKLLSFAPTISLKGLTFNSRSLDPAVLAPLDSAAWDSLATFVVDRLSDSIIRSAESELPPEYRPEREERVTGRLIARRNGLHAAAMDYYRALALVVDVHGTDEPDRSRVAYAADGAVTISLYAREEAEDDAPYFERRFVPGQTREVRVYLHGGDDTVSVSSAGRSDIVVRIIGGKGDNAVSDAGGLARIYDFPEPPEEFTYGPDTLFDRRPWRVEDGDTLPPLPDRGGSMAPTVDVRYYTDLGLITSIGSRMTRYGFRTWPYARLTTLELDHAWGPNDTRFRIGMDLRREGGGLHPVFRGLASGLEVIRWYGSGNETVRIAEGANNRIEHGRYAAELMAGVDLLGGTLEVGPAMQYARTDRAQPAFGSAAPYGAGEFGLVGARARWRSDSRRTGDEGPLSVSFSAEGSAFPAAWDAEESFGSLGADARAYLSVATVFDPVLALRAGGRTVFGTYPFFESAFLGGASTLRGFDEQRFAGDAMAYGGAELRLELFRVPWLGLGFGVHGIADGGRVWLDGEDSDEWHHATGGGFSLGFDRPAGVLTVTIADSDERTGAYIELGFTF
ncbi:MAG TPA: BamA/TamA family outer membrane protein [Gemmatimonadales bacterium]|nr:BamA/TamA family outer membrane protein [Gemmatimonadales bacterium]